MATKNVVIRVPKNTVMLPDNAQYTNRFEIRSSSSNRVYIVAQHKTSKWWGCSCPGWIGHRKCKHLSSMSLPCYQVPLEVSMVKSA
jgi:hypothetical protein